MKEITIMIDSGSRPFLLEQTLPTIVSSMKYQGPLRWIFHEVWIDSDLSRENLKFISSNYPEFEIMEQRNPKGEGISINNVLTETKTKYFVHWEDDFIALRDIPLDDSVSIMESSPDVNQIAFNRRDTMVNCSDFFKKEIITKDGFKLVTSPHWRYTPAIWNLDWIIPRWEVYEGNNSHWHINKKLQKDCGDKTADWVIENMGTYYFGKFDEKAFCKHVGDGYSNRNPKI